MSQSPPSRTSFDNPTSQSERAAILRERDRAINTRVAYGDVVDPLPQGRWKKPAQPSDPTKLYPPMPASSPWACDPVGLEPPFPGDIGYVEVCGTDAEIAQAAAILSAATDNLQGGSCADAGNSSPAVAANLSPLLGLAEGPSPTPEATSPVGSDSRATDPTFGSTDPSASSFAEDQDLAAPPVDAETSREGETPRVELRRGGAAPFSSGWRRIG